MNCGRVLLTVGEFCCISGCARATRLGAGLVPCVRWIAMRVPPRAGRVTMYAAEITRKVARIVAADERHDLLDGEEGALEQQAGASHADGAQKGAGCDADLAPKQVREARSREIHAHREIRDRDRRGDVRPHVLDGPRDSRIHGVATDLSKVTAKMLVRSSIA
jgi:hypothetical protein